MKACHDSCLLGLRTTEYFGIYIEIPKIEIDAIVVTTSTIFSFLCIRVLLLQVHACCGGKTEEWRNNIIVNDMHKYFIWTIWLTTKIL